jgi:hypothetical protein
LCCCLVVGANLGDAPQTGAVLAWRNVYTLIAMHIHAQHDPSIEQFITNLRSNSTSTSDRVVAEGQSISVSCGGSLTTMTRVDPKNVDLYDQQSVGTETTWCAK